MTKVSAFASKVYECCKQIPKGKVTTYKNIAVAIGKPGACQAVGMALSKNPFAPKVPCHRVVQSNGTLGGFMGTKDVKSKNIKDKVALLKSEGVAVIDNAVDNFDELLFVPEPLNT